MTIRIALDDDDKIMPCPVCKRLVPFSAYEEFSRPAVVDVDFVGAQKYRRDGALVTLRGWRCTPHSAPCGLPCFGAGTADFLAFNSGRMHGLPDVGCPACFAFLPGPTKA